MVEHPGDRTPDAPAGRRTVLLALNADAIRSDAKSGIYDHARRAGWRIVDLFLCNMAMPPRVRADGALLALGGGSTSLVKQLDRMGIPRVHLDSLTHADAGRVDQDLRATGRMAAGHFAERGFRNMAYLHAEFYEDSHLRSMGDSFIARARQRGAKADLIAVNRPGDIVPWSHVERMAKRFGREIAKLEKPLGVFTYNDIMAARICLYCEILGLRVPEQVAVLGRNNNVHQCNFAPTPLSSVDTNNVARAKVAAELLESLMDGGPVPAEPILVPPAGVVTRRSTDVLALPDADTASALRYIWEHFAEPLNVAGIADAVGLSRRKLERHFREHLGRSVNEELMRKRIERACELLTSTKTKGKHIAEQVGFTSEKYFYVRFRRIMGTTPRQYRLAHTAKARQGENAETDSRP